MSGCDYCDEGLPKEDPVPSREPPGGWHLRVDPDGYEPTQRIPCMLERNEEQAWTMVNKISGLIEERDSLRERVAFLVAEAHGWQPRLEAAEAEVARLREALGFYAAEASWRPEPMYALDASSPGGPGTRWDKGFIARAALAAPTKEDA